MPGTGPKVGRGMREYRGMEAKAEGCDHSGTVQAHCYHPRLPDSIPAKNSQLQLSLATQTSCLGGYQESSCIVSSMSFDRRQYRQRPDCPLERLENGLGSVTMLSSVGDLRSVIRIG